MGSIAQVILAQLGGSRFLAMTGTSKLLALDNGLQFALPFPSAPNKIRITLDPTDTYTVGAFRVSKFEVKNRGTVEDVYAEDLRWVFTQLTGLETSL